MTNIKGFKEIKTCPHQQQEIDAGGKFIADQCCVSIKVLAVLSMPTQTSQL